ncbi:Membrane-bound inhibitor of C-type lysozyme [Nitrosomonas eutropha]|uniref:Membrane-bound inhibitor of C-type lysozyme n=1 Tax=Nitrosomonas eutropha TaxID=916 RepID=A0A1I7GAJ0_9PROT|nr:MliC family protein [Nitrosomonas eutropha]SFU45391.1 Membrane-bound inhibitor of C-type lysozyme [Nitrosomonas eutropha]
MKLFLKYFILFSLLATLASCTPLTPPSPTTSIISSVTFVSDSRQAVRAVYRDDDTVTLTFPDGRTEILVLAVSASGARYVLEENEWWEHQGEATYSTSNQIIFAGKLQAPTQ